MVQSAAASVEEYLAELPPERAEVVEQVRRLVLDNVPDGIGETMNWGMISYEIPLERYPETYNGQPLGYAALAAQKHPYSLYLYSVYSAEAVEQALRDAYADAGVKLDVGKSCVRFKRLEQLVTGALADAISAITVDQYIERYEASRRGRRA
ncbi:MAG: DUF1801 domain-containing protein [Ilumatobacteraceae bacterium]